MPHKQSFYVAVQGNAMSDRLPALGPASSRGSMDAPPAPTTIVAPESTGLPSLTHTKPPQDDGSAGSEKRKKYLSRTKTILGQANKPEEEKPEKFNPEPIPFQSQSFNSCLTARSIGSDESLFKASGMAPKKPPTNKPRDIFASKGNFMMYTDRLQCDAFDRNLISPSQRERLQAEYEYIERLKALQKRRDMLPHRESYNFLMGGHKVSLCERFDVMKELNQLKCVVLPSRAKDLYVGRGFSERLPSDHALNHPRVPTKVKTGASNNDNSSKKSFREEKKAPSNDGKWPSNSGNGILPEGTNESQPAQRTNNSNPLKGYHADRSLNVDEIESLKESFSKLMVDNSGRLTFEEFRTRLPEGVTSNQETYIKEVFDMTNENGFFGEDEYISINALCKTIAAAEGVISECYETVDMAEASKALTRYTELFEEADSGESGALPLTSLKGLLSTARDQEVNDEAFNAIQQTLVKYGEEINAVDFISLVPYFMSVTL